MNVGFTFARNAERGAMNDSDTFWINCSHTIRSSTSTSLIKNKQTKTFFKHQHHRRHHKQQWQLLFRIPKVQTVLHLGSHIQIVFWALKRKLLMNKAATTLLPSLNPSSFPLTEVPPKIITKTKRVTPGNELCTLQVCCAITLYKRMAWSVAQVIL